MNEKPTKHEIVYWMHSPHNNEHWYQCKKCGLSDWIASYGTRNQLSFYSKPCKRPKVPK